MSKLPQIVIGIPGAWKDRSEIVTSIASGSGGHLFAGSVMMHLETKASFNVEISDHDPAMRTAFEIAGGGHIPEKALDEIESHTHTLYVSTNGGSPEAARGIMHAADGLLLSGGIAAKVESAGVAHSVTQWRELTHDSDPAALLNAFVAYVGENGLFYSCGMHNLGYRDAILRADIPADQAAGLLHTFGVFLVVDEPALHDGDTFSIDEDSGSYRMEKVPCDMFDRDDLFHNPYGMWQLSPE